jgi:hypothetical protein
MINFVDLSDTRGDLTFPNVLVSKSDIYCLLYGFTLDMTSLPEASSYSVTSNDGFENSFSLVNGFRRLTTAVLFACLPSYKAA